MNRLEGLIDDLPGVLNGASPVNGRVPDETRTLLVDKLPNRRLTKAERASFEKDQRLCVLERTPASPKGAHQALLGEAHLRHDQKKCPLTEARWCLRCGAVHVLDGF